MSPINLQGKKFGRLTVTGYLPASKGTGHAWWHTRCICGKGAIVRGSRLRDGTTKSCGCLAKEVAREVLTKYAKSKKHKGRGNPMWKGSNAKHSSIHTCLNRHYKKKECEECGSEKNLDWALKHRKNHAHDKARYRVLCRSHHLKYDYKNKIR